MKKISQLGHDKKTIHLPGFLLKVPNKQIGGYKPSSEWVLPHYTISSLYFISLCMDFSWFVFNMWQDPLQSIIMKREWIFPQMWTIPFHFVIRLSYEVFLSWALWMRNELVRAFYRSSAAKQGLERVLSAPIQSSIKDCCNHSCLSTCSMMLVTRSSRPQRD